VAIEIDVASKRSLECYRLAGVTKRADRTARSGQSTFSIRIAQHGAFSFGNCRGDNVAWRVRAFNAWCFDASVFTDAGSVRPAVLKRRKLRTR
jgi:hypothetical protein